MITTRRLTALGPAIATTGAALGGPTINFVIPAGLKVAAITARLRTRLMSAPVQNGSVLVQAAVVESPTMNITSPSSGSDALENGTALWAGARYVSTAQGARFMPGIAAGPVESLCVVARVWNRDNLDDTRRITVDVTVILCGPDEDVGGVESGHELGDFSIGTGTTVVVTTEDPAAPGSEVSYTQGIGLVWRLQGAQVVLTAAAVAATRTVNLDLARGGVSLVRIGAWPGVTTGQGARLQWALGNIPTSDPDTSAATNPMRQGAWVNSRSIGGDIYATVTGSLQGADDFAAMVLLVEEWVVPEVAAS